MTDHPIAGIGRVYVIDDDPAVRGSLGSLFRSTGYDVDLFESPGAFLAADRRLEPSCLVLDVRLRAESGLDFQQQLARQGEPLPVILITAHGDIPMTVRGMKAGAVDFLPKPFREDEILSAVAAALRVDRARQEERTEKLELEARHATLTRREQEVMSLVSSGLLNKQIASRLGLSEVTVKIHRGGAMRKMAAGSLADLVRMAELLGVRDETITRFNTRV